MAQRYWRNVLGGLAAAGLLAGCATTTQTDMETPAMTAGRDYSYGYWVNGYRKADGDPAPDILALETGYFGLALDLEHLERPRLGRFQTPIGYAAALTARDGRLADLGPAALHVDLEIDGATYRARSCARQRAWMRDSGRVAQHYELRDLHFADDAGNELPSIGQLHAVVWPESLTLTASLEPDLLYRDGPAPGVVGNGLCVIAEPQSIAHDPALDPAGVLTVECWINLPERLNRRNHAWLLGKNDNEWGDGNYGFVLHGKTIAAAFNVGGGPENAVWLRPPGRLARDQWHHLALTYDGTTLRYYIDGKEVGKKEIGRTRTPGSGDVRLGQRPDGVTHGNSAPIAPALFDQLRVWNRVLPPTEIQAHHRQPANPGNRAGLTFEESFDTGAGDAVTTPAWHDATVRIALRGAGHEWRIQKQFPGTWRKGERRPVTLNCQIGGGEPSHRQVVTQVATPQGQAFPVRFDPLKNAYVATVRNVKRSFNGGYVKITDYDAFKVTIDCDEAAPPALPFMLDMRGVANVTGLVPILCEPDGTPTGVPVQLSKNWHDGYNYLGAYAQLPLRQGRNEYLLRVVYGFYGALPSASHAQLCLIGYGGCQRWDQLALACGGESITFDADMSLTDVAICDVRVPMGQNGVDGNPWGWTDAGWGGDWLGVFENGHKLTFAGMKVAYLAHGPCLSDVRYAGAYGADHSVAIEARIQLPRTDDYGRTFQQLRYTFHRELPAAGSYLMKRHARAFDRAVAYGNGDGLIAELRLDGDLAEGDLLLPPTELTGPGPWWVAFPDRDQPPTGYASIIVRDYDAAFSGRRVTNPSLQVKITERRGDEAKLETWFVPPTNVKRYQPGDHVTMDAEWVHLVTQADDYGGPNEAYRMHLAENPRSWKTTYREARGNDLDIAVDGGMLLQELPIVIRADKPQVTVAITGGIGYLPVRFENLGTATGYALYEVVGGEKRKLDQSVHGNDFWQTDYDSGTDSYKMTFNLPVDGKTSSTWELRSDSAKQASGSVVVHE